MKRIKVSENFSLDEFLDVRSYLKDEDRGRSKIDPRIIDCAQLLRVKFGKPIRINNWWGLYLQLVDEGKAVDQIIRIIENSKSVSKWSGFRPPECKIGAKRSQHRKGTAIDPKGDQHALELIVRNNAKEFYNFGLRRLEDPSITPGWLHMDLSEANHKAGFIRVVGRTSHSYNIPIK